ncbi:MAG: cob(I)yrinic acid a,c-diamide adenosyltransferase [Chloroflexota bacterium]
MKAGIYTRGGDAGQTSLLGGLRVDKDDPRVEAYGTLDETTCAMGLARATSRYDDLCRLIIDLQGDMIPVMSEIATLPGTMLKSGPPPQVSPAQVERLERFIDQYNAEWIQSRQFTRPGGSPASAALDMARSTCRRAERRLITLGRSEPVNPELFKYLNRLSDLLYVLARIDEQRTVIDAITRQLAAQPAAEQAGEPASIKGENLMLLSSIECDRMMLAGIHKAEALGVPMVLSIVDQNGDVIQTRRMDNALVVSITLAPNKAYTAAAVRMPTEALNQLTQPGQPLFDLQANLPRITPVGGGLPLCGKDGQLVGAVGVSGGSVEQDIAVAQAMLAVF